MDNKLNIPMIQAIQAAITEESDSFDMRNWYDDGALFRQENCGTSLCIGGYTIHFAITKPELAKGELDWHYKQHVENVKDDYLKLNHDGSLTAVTAAKILNLPSDQFDDEEAVELFDANCWPEPFKTEYEKAEYELFDWKVKKRDGQSVDMAEKQHIFRKETAQIAIARLQHLIDFGS
ncbi:MAG: hypothetical protein WBB28_01200 [Crinalium sp.]